MKKMIVLLTFILFTDLAFAQKHKAVLYFKDGESIEGLASITKSKKVKYRKDKKSKKFIYDSRNLTHFYLNKIGKKETVLKKYYYKKAKESDSFILLELLIEGKVNLYRKSQEYATRPHSNATIHTYYLSRDNEEKVTSLGSTFLFTKNFKQATADYFKDCAELVEKINKREFRKPNITDMVDYYNNNCN